jgi:zinc transport system substrate-binding protein
MHFRIWILLLVPLAARAPGQLPVAVTITPQKYFVEQVGGEKVRITVMIPPAVDPHTFEPKPRQLVELSAARIYFAIGSQFEQAWLPRLMGANPRLVVIRTDAGVPRRQETGENHGPADTLHQDSHIWLSPRLVKIQANNICRGLAAAAPVDAGYFQRNLERFLGRIDSLDIELKILFQPLAGKGEFLVFHPDWGYFGDEYGLKQVAIERNGKEPNPRELRKIIDEVRAHQVRVVFNSPQFSPKSAQVIARELGATVALVDPLAEDWAANLRRAAEAFRQAMVTTP